MILNILVKEVLFMEWVYLFFGISLIIASLTCLVLYLARHSDKIKKKIDKKD